MGYRAIRAQSGIPGVRGAYGVGRGDLYYEPADAALPTETLWSTSAYLNHAPKLFERLSMAHDDEIEWLHDVQHSLTPIEHERATWREGEGTTVEISVVPGSLTKKQSNAMTRLDGRRM